MLQELFLKMMEKHLHGMSSSITGTPMQKECTNQQAENVPSIMVT